MLKIQDSLATELSDESSSESSDEETLAVMCELVFTPKEYLGPRINLEDITVLNCEQYYYSGNNM